MTPRMKRVAYSPHVLGKHIVRREVGRVVPPLPCMAAFSTCLRLLSLPPIHSTASCAFRQDGIAGSTSMTSRCAPSNSFRKRRRNSSAISTAHSECTVLRTSQPETRTVLRLCSQSKISQSGPFPRLRGSHQVLAPKTLQWDTSSLPHAPASLGKALATFSPCSRTSSHGRPRS